MTAPERELRSRSIRRDVNERIAQLARGFPRDAADDPTMTVFCECGTEDCTAPIEMTVSEYQAVRLGPTRWVVSSAHIDATMDSIIARRNGYALIDHASERLSREAPTPRKEPISPRMTMSTER